MLHPAVLLRLVFCCRNVSTLQLCLAFGFLWFRSNNVELANSQMKSLKHPAYYYYYSLFSTEVEVVVA